MQLFNQTLTGRTWNYTLICIRSLLEVQGKMVLSAEKTDWYIGGALSWRVLWPPVAGLMPPRWCWSPSPVLSCHPTQTVKQVRMKLSLRFILTQTQEAIIFKNFRDEAIMPGISGKKWERSRPGRCSYQRIGLPQALIGILRQEAGEAFGDLFVDRNQAMFEDQHPDPTPLCRSEARFGQQFLLGHRRIIYPVARGIQDLSHPFDTIQLIDEDVRIYQ